MLWQVMLSMEIEMIVMNVIMKMMIHDVFNMISMQLMCILHVIHHVVAMIVNVHLVTLFYGSESL